MALRYKLTDCNDRTTNNCQWGEGVQHESSGEGELCRPGWIHVYTHPLLAVMFNPIHRKDDLNTAHLWEVECEGECKEDCGFKEGWTRVRTVRRVEMPVVTREQKTRFAILCAWEVCPDEAWRRWAFGWLSGADRTATPVVLVERLAQVAVWSARAEEAAWWAAWAAVWAAEEAAPRALNLVALAEEAMTEATRAASGKEPT